MAGCIKCRVDSIYVWWYEYTSSSKVFFLTLVLSLCANVCLLLLCWKFALVTNIYWPRQTQKQICWTETKEHRQRHWINIFFYLETGVELTLHSCSAVTGTYLIVLYFCEAMIPVDPVLFRPWKVDDDLITTMEPPKIKQQWLRSHK